MFEVEIWIDIVLRDNGRGETMCTLFANHQMPMRPNIGETLSFQPMKGTKLEYTTILPASPVRQSNVSVSIEEVRHYAVNNEGTMVFKTALNCSEVPVASKEDAQEVSNFMINQCGFEIDSYGVNNLES